MKLTKAQKQERKEIKANLIANGGMITRFGRVTIAMEPTCRGKGLVTWAVCSPNETPKRKYGEWVCLNRGSEACTLPVELDNGMVTIEQMETIAYAVVFDPDEGMPTESWPFLTRN